MATTTRILDANVNGTVYTANANDALEALDTCHSGTTAPTDEVSNGKLWLDTSTTPSVLKVYDNAGWNVVYSGRGDLTVAGTVNATALTGNGSGITGVATAAQGTLADSAVQPNDSPTFGTVTATTYAGDGSALTGIESVPASTVIYVAQNTAPTGYVKANGAALSRTTYAGLFAAIGTTFGVGDGSTTFNVPDLRGEFLRGWDDGRGIDSGRSFGSFQDHQLQEHQHQVNRRTVLENPANNNSGGAYILQHWSASTSGVKSSEARTVTNGNAGAETRPRNVALLACIKF